MPPSRSGDARRLRDGIRAAPFLPKQMAGLADFVAVHLLAYPSGNTRLHFARSRCSITQVLIFKRLQVKGAAASRVAVAWQFWSTATREQRHAQDLTFSLGRRSTQKRAAVFLLEVDDRHGSAGTFTWPMTRCDIAN